MKVLSKTPLLLALAVLLNVAVTTARSSDDTAVIYQNASFVTADGSVLTDGVMAGLIDAHRHHAYCSCA